MKSTFWMYTCLVAFASVAALPVSAQDVSVLGAAPESVATTPLPQPAEWALRAGLALGPAIDTFGFVGVLDADLAYRPHSVPMVFRLEAIPAAVGVTKDGSGYAGYSRALVGLSLEYLEVAIGASVGTDGFGSYSTSALGGVSLDARFGRLDGTHVSIFADTVINPDALAFEFGRAGGVVAVALPRAWTLRVEGEFNAAGIVRGTVGARSWLRGEGGAGSLSLGGKLGVAGVFRDLHIWNGPDSFDNAAGPVIGLDVEYRL